MARDAMELEIAIDWPKGWPLPAIGDRIHVRLGFDGCDPAYVEPQVIGVYATASWRRKVAVSMPVELTLMARTAGPGEGRPEGG